MISLSGLSYGYNLGDTVFTDVSIALPSDRRIAVLGRELSGKTTLIHVLAGLLMPTRGRIERFARLSFPAGYQRGFRMNDSARRNIEFAASIYDADPGEVVAFIRSVTPFGDMLDRPMRALPAQVRIGLSYVLTYALPFDTYLFDNGIAPPGPALRDLCGRLFEARMETAGAIIATRFPRVAEQLCDCAVVIRQGKLSFYEDVAEAIALAERDEAAETASRLAELREPAAGGGDLEGVA